MKKPILFVVDDDEQVLQSVTRDLKSQYRKRYRVLSTSSASEGLESLPELKRKGEDIALFLSDQRMPEMLGVDFLEQAKLVYPEAKRALLTAYSDTDAAIRAINDVQLDYYLMKPWDPPEEKLFPTLDELLGDWGATHIPTFQGLRVVGQQYSAQAHKVKDFLAGNLFPYQWIDADNDDGAEELMKLHGVEKSQLPAVIFEDGSSVVGDSLLAIAERLGLKPNASEKVYDVTIVGAGPAGLAAAVYGASEGLKTLLIEKRAPGGQAGTSSRIENYLGFPTGLSGADLTRRAITQATRFGTEFLSPQQVKQISVNGPFKTIELIDGSEVSSRAVVITTGVDYRRLEAPGLDKFTGAGVYYGAASTEATSCQDKDVYVVGGGNSAGQAAMYLSKFACKVYILIRKTSLDATMSSYLIDQINQTDNIELQPETEVKEAIGEGSLESLRLEKTDGSDSRIVGAAALFIFIGARPYTDWLPESILTDAKGFVMTGRDLNRHDEFSGLWKTRRDPYLLETSSPGIFAAGDVRSGAMNRVASAVGEGAMSISFVHKYLAES